MSDRPVSVLDGPYAYDWARILGERVRRHASQRATTSSRTPGRVNRGVVYANEFTHGELHLCTCGQKKHQCASCSAWICQATGHAKHVCGGVW